MSDFLRERMFGVRPVHRTNSQSGQSEWYYLDPRNNHRLADRPEIDVENENSPNPYAYEIQNYLYENDAYNYKQLYGNTPPPSMQPTQTGANVGTNNIGSSDVNDGLNDYQRAMLNVAQTAAKGNYMSGVNGANNGQVFANSDYTVNTESLVGKPSSYFQNNNSTYPQQSQTVQNTNNDNIEAQKQAQALQAQRDAVNQILMNGMDVLYGMNRTVNGMTAGGLDWIGNKLGYDTQMNNYLQLKNPQERELAQNVGQIAQLGGGVLAGNALAKSGLKSFVAWNGRRNLINQLTDGTNFKDVRYRNISDDYRNILNNKRQDVNQPLMQNNRMYIPANVVRKLYAKRIINDGMTPEDVANSIDNAIYNPNSAIFQTKYNQNQALVNSSGNKLDIGFVSVNPSKPNQNVIKSDYQIKIDDLYRTLFGPK